MRKLATFARLFDDRALYCQLIVTRRCNLSCGYCNEFDKVSTPVPVEVLIQRINHLTGELGVTIIDFLGGEPLLHPELPQIIAHARARGCWTNVITNGFLLSTEKIEDFNRAGLNSMCVSIDRINPNDCTHKGLRPLRKRLLALRNHARFHVETNAVLCEETLDEFEPLVREIQELGFPVRCGVRHYAGRMDLNGTLQAKFEWFQQNYRHWRIAPMLELHRARLEGRPSEWKCAGGYKFLYVDEYGTVKACSQVSLRNPVQLTAMRRVDLKRNDDHKPCEAVCGVSCVIQTSLFTQQPFRYVARCARHLVEARFRHTMPVSAVAQSGIVTSS